MSAIVLDTHALIWMLVEPVKLSTDATKAINKAVDEGESIYFSAISIVEPSLASAVSASLEPS